MNAEPELALLAAIAASLAAAIPAADARAMLLLAAIATLGMFARATAPRNWK